MTDLPTNPDDRTEVMPAFTGAQPTPAAAGAPAPTPTPAAPAPPDVRAASHGPARAGAVQRTALVVLAGIGALMLAFIVMILVGVTGESINALAVFATPIASMVAAYYGITLSIQQVRNERAEKEKAIARADAADAASRETEVWSAQMESGLRVAMAKLVGAGIRTDEVTKAAGTPEGFF
ncbi:hypothetical protein QMG61_15035 [Cryobacterium sp. PH31-AA6]|uniref:hypothetical protein n=1 Tax=Cryobacterium sp. PH31-AA6 TaxID=3046205 RepID=UPI0024B9DD88|nr:hypothetical protein [Cryobacterium sp. PH31-AA6]MDJ0325078.1 hypothetical protein [Cryobacterium sp. PH31-AA6]